MFVVRLDDGDLEIGPAAKEPRCHADAGSAGANDKDIE